MITIDPQAYLAIAGVGNIFDDTFFLLSAIVGVFILLAALTKNLAVVGFVGLVSFLHMTFVTNFSKFENIALVVFVVVGLAAGFRIWDMMSEGGDM